MNKNNNILPNENQARDEFFLVYHQYCETSSSQDLRDLLCFIQNAMDQGVAPELVAAAFPLVHALAAYCHIKAHT